MDSHNPTSADSSNSPAGPAGSSARLKEQYESLARPAIQQAAVNFRVWMPFLTNPFQRSTLVRFSAEDDRVGLTWDVKLPRQCWRCGQTAKLSPRDYRQSLRAFDNPVGLLAGSAAGIFIGLLVMALLGGVYSLFLLLLIVVVAAAITLLKSWREEIELTLFSCADHAHQPPQLAMAIDDQFLCVFLPTAELANATAADIQARRKLSAGRRPESRDSGTPPRSYEPPPREPAPSEAPIRIVRPEAVDLPPIKLAGDEDETPSSGSSS